MIGNYSGGAFLYDSNAGVMTDLGGFNACDINNVGQIAGRYWPTNAVHAILYDSRTGETIDLGTLGSGYTDSEAYGINDSGQVVGASWTSGDSPITHAFFWENGIMTDLGTLGGTYSYAMDINNCGQIVGYSERYVNDIARGFLWESGSGMQDLNDLTELPGWIIDNGEAINDNGDIADAVASGGEGSRAFLLTYIPEPSTFALLIIGACILRCRRR